MPRAAFRPWGPCARRAVRILYEYPVYQQDRQPDVPQPGCLQERGRALGHEALRVNARHPDRQDELQAIVRSSPWLMRALRAARDLGLPQWCIGAGALRNRVWDHLHGHTEPSRLADVDLVYFDPEEPPGLEASIRRPWRAPVRICPGS